MFKVTYGLIDPFDGLAPMPFVERTVSPVHYAKKHGDIESFVLRGTITGLKCQENHFEELWTKANQLINNFSIPFQKFKITEPLISASGANSGVLYSNGYAIVRSIDFDQNAFAGILPFSVSLDVFREDTFNNYGILEPSQQISFEHAENGDVNIKKTTSAVGFNTEASAIDNAVAFVNNLTGLSTISNPLFIPNANISGAILVSFDKKINRLNGSYEVSEGWVYNHYGNKGQYSLYEKTSSIESGVEGFSVSVNGKIKGGINSSFDNLRSDFSALDIFAIAEDIYNLNANGNLYSQPMSRQISESSLDKTIDFEYTFVDRISSDPYTVDSLDVTKDFINNKTCVNAQITVKSIDPCLSARWTKVKNFADSFSIMDWMNGRLEELDYDLTLPNAPSSSSTSYSEQNGTISMTAAVCDKKIEVPEHFDDFVYTISIKPALPTFVPFQGIDCGGAHTVQKLGGLTRKVLTIQGTGRVATCSSQDAAEQSLRNYINNLKLDYLIDEDVFLSQHNIQFGTGEQRKTVSFTFAWNESAPTIFSDDYLHSSLS